jgi:AcrR family transcriptional regulator
MSPRPYQAGKRKVAADRTRARILRAARELLTAKGGTGRFSLDAVARRAGVARMTVYYQFGSRRGLFEALFDAFAAGGELPERIGAAFRRPDPEDALADVVAAFARFWDAGRPWIRRLRALGVLDRELGEALEARNARRRQVVRTLLNRLPQRHGQPAAADRAEAEEILYTLTSFETFDTLAGPDRSLEDVAPAVLHLARIAVGVTGSSRK